MRVWRKAEIEVCKFILMIQLYAYCRVVSTILGRVRGKQQGKLQSRQHASNFEFMKNTILHPREWWLRNYSYIFTLTNGKHYSTFLSLNPTHHLYYGTVQGHQWHSHKKCKKLLLAFFSALTKLVSTSFCIKWIHRFGLHI